MDKGIWKEAIREDAYKEIVGSHDRCKERIYVKKGKGLPFVQREERRSKGICEGAVEEGLHPAI